jgi:rare lipoprotein A
MKPLITSLILVLLCLFAEAKKAIPKTLEGVASFYADKFEGRRTAMGTTFSNKGMTCACNQLPLGTWVRVTNLKNNAIVEVQVTDRLAANNKRVCDLTKAAAKELGFVNSGLTKVKVEVIKKKSQEEIEKIINNTDTLANDSI